MDFMVGRYGDFVRYRPPLKPVTWLLWLGPFLLLAIAFALLITYLRRRGKQLAQAEPGALSEEEQARAASLLQTDSDRIAP
jgi:cytochrome c-type biogenesis protein CcmH